MDGESFFHKLGRVKAGIGLVAGIFALGLAGVADAAPGGRDGDPVVLKGSSVAGLIGVAPESVVGFAYRGGRWVQIPVQVDERHTIDVRQLYPAGNHPPYVGNDDPDFDLDVYADPKTRSGADSNPDFDADDELVFMGGDTGSRAPKGIGSPPNVFPGTGTVVNVTDPDDGGKAYVYLFRANGDLNQSGGKDYVKYDFKLTNLTAGQSLKDDYGYFHSFNPEDSTVKTKNYELHSIDRWMEDEMHVTAGEAGGQDILDREVAQATLIACVRSEYTFSGRWVQDSWAGNDASSDDEGTYIAVIDGPVRAIRSYMGANSGPYVQREHIYYRDREDNSIYLRVHPMTDLYSWTDYSDAAIGMTYRDSKNTAGVPVDGEPDTLAPMTTADVANGAYAWQQLSGPQGTVSTVVSSDTDIPNASFGNYYLDDSTPTGLDQTQCGGDGKSIGASGFGILGPTTPNTDPRNPPFNNLTVKRTRYFGPPSDGAKQAADYKSRVEKPLAAVSASSPMKKPTGGLAVIFVNRRVKAHPGKPLTVKLKAKNIGNTKILRARVCLTSRKLTGRLCRQVGSLDFGKSRILTFRVKVKPSTKGKVLRFGYKADGESTEYGFNNGGMLFQVALRR